MPLSFASSPFLREHGRFIVGLTALYAVLTVPFLTTIPVTWDAAQFVLGVERFHLGQHRPHPPGYPVYVFVGKLLAPVLGAHGALVGFTAFLGWLSAVALYGFAFRWSRSSAVAALTSAVWILNPVFWRERLVALTYTADALTSLAVAWWAYEMLRVPSSRACDRRLLVAGPMALGWLGGVRPSLLPLFVPLLLLPLVVRRRPREGLIALLALLAVVASWFAPMAHLAGGLSKYLEVNRVVLGSAAAGTSIFAKHDAGLANLSFFGVTLLAAMGPMWLVVVAGMWGVPSTAPLRTPRWLVAAFFAVWLGPSFFVYGALHCAKTGYALTVVPVVYVFFAVMAKRAWASPGRRRFLGITALASCIHVIALVPSPTRYGRVPWPMITVLEMTSVAQVRDSERALTKIVEAARDTLTRGPTVVFSAFPHPTPWMLDVPRVLMAVLPEVMVVQVTDMMMVGRGGHFEISGKKKLSLPPEVTQVLAVTNRLPGGRELPELELRVVAPSDLQPFHGVHLTASTTLDPSVVKSEWRNFDRKTLRSRSKAFFQEAGPHLGVARRGSAASGHVVFGPYVDLAPGAYVVRWILTLEGPAGLPSPRPLCSLDVADGGGKTVFARFALWYRGAYDVVLPFEVQGEKKRRGIEFRLECDGTSDIVLDAVRLAEHPK